MSESLRGPRALIIEDDTSYARTLAAILGDIGVMCDTAADDERAFECLARARYDLIIVDLGGDAGSFNLNRELFCEGIRRRHAGSPIIGVTNLNLPGGTVFSLPRYIDAFFHKPAMGLDDFRSTVRRLLGASRADVPAGRQDPPGGIFVSFSDRDRATAERLIHALRAAGLEVWWSRDLVGGERFVSVIAERLRDARVFLVLWSEAAAGSGWVANELETAIDLENSGGRPRVVLVRLDRADVPVLLRRKQEIPLVDLAQLDRAVAGVSRLVSPLA